MTQRRSTVNDCLLQGRFNAFFPFCYPNTLLEGRNGPASYKEFGPYYNVTKYRWSSFGYAGGDSDSGFVVNFDSDALKATKRVAELKADRWIDQSTRWVRVDMAMYNPSANLFSHAEFMVELDNTGKMWPTVRVTTMKTEAYLNQTRDYIQIVLEIVVMLGKQSPIPPLPLCPWQSSRLGGLTGGVFGMLLLPPYASRSFCLETPPTTTVTVATLVHSNRWIHCRPGQKLFREQGPAGKLLQLLYVFLELG